MNIKLVDDAHLVWRYWSARLNAAGAAVMSFFMLYPQMVKEAWENLPDSIKSVFPPSIVMGLGIALVVAGSIAQFIKQRKLDELRDKQ